MIINWLKQKLIKSKPNKRIIDKIFIISTNTDNIYKDPLIIEKNYIICKNKIDFCGKTKCEISEKAYIYFQEIVINFSKSSCW